MECWFIVLPSHPSPGAPAHRARAPRPHLQRHVVLLQQVPVIQAAVGLPHLQSRHIGQPPILLLTLGGILLFVCIRIVADGGL